MWRIGARSKAIRSIDWHRFILRVNMNSSPSHSSINTTHGSAAHLSIFTQRRALPDTLSRLVPLYYTHSWKSVKRFQVYLSLSNLVCNQHVTLVPCYTFIKSFLAIRQGVVGERALLSSRWRRAAYGCWTSLD